MFEFGKFEGICSSAALVVCPLLGQSGIEPTCYSRNVDLGKTLVFQPATSFVHIVAIIMTAIMIFHIRSKYTAVGRKEIVTFFYLYAIIEALAIFLDSGIIPTSNQVYPWFAAAYTGLVAAEYTCLLINGFVGFQFAEDGTPLSLWFLRLSCLLLFGISFFIAIATFKNLASFSNTNSIPLWIVYFLWPAICTVVYIVSQLILVVRTLDDRWPLGDIIIGAIFFAVAQLVLFAFSTQICDAVKHYIDGLFFFTVCILLSVMMVYKYWDSITKEDLEFSVGSKAAVWEVKEPFLGNGGGAGEQWEEDAVSHYGGAAPSLVGGISGGQYYQHQQPPPPLPQGPGYNYPPPHGYGNERF
ncbi:Chitin synthase, class 7 [Serendipita sp. 400]|nr:Chitin synthase, class 7 [Serendipita sp. 400]